MTLGLVFFSFFFCPLLRPLALLPSPTSLAQDSESSTALFTVVSLTSEYISELDFHHNALEAIQASPDASPNEIAPAPFPIIPYPALLSEGNRHGSANRNVSLPQRAHGPHLSYESDLECRSDCVMA